MMLMGALAHTKGTAFRQEEAETWRRFESVKGYYRADLPYANVSFYNMLTKHGYRRYKRMLGIKVWVKRLLTWRK